MSGGECTSFPKATRGFKPIAYIGALLSTLLHAIADVFTQFGRQKNVYRIAAQNAL
jgi:hypothetical protein